MPKAEQVSVTVQEQAPKPAPVQIEDRRARSVELFVRKIALAALTMLGIGYVLTNVPISLLIVESISATPIASQTAVNTIAGKLLFLVGSIVSALLGGLIIYGAVQFYEHSLTKGIVFLGILLASFQLFCLGVGSTLLLPELNLAALMLTIGPSLVVASVTTYMSHTRKHQLVGAVLGIASGSLLAYAIFNLHVYNVIFAWNIPFTGPFMSMTLLESVVLILAPFAALVNTILNKPGGRVLPHSLVLLVALVYGVGAFTGALVLSMSFWNLIWKAPWLGPLYGVSESILTTVVFWSASLVLLDIGGILLIVAACLGFVHVSHLLSQLDT